MKSKRKFKKEIDKRMFVVYNGNNFERWWKY